MPQHVARQPAQQLIHRQGARPGDLRVQDHAVQPRLSQQAGELLTEFPGVPATA